MTFGERLSIDLWSWYAHTYDGLLHFWPYTHLLEQVTGRLSLADDDRVLELGCGTGNVLNLILSGSSADVVGIDLSDTMLAIAKKKLEKNGYGKRITLVQGDLVDLLRREADKSYEAIVSVNVLYAIDDQEELWRQIMRVIKPGGMIVITTSVRTGSWPIIRESLQNAPWYSLLRPRLLGVFIIDSLINLLGRTGHYGFHDQNHITNCIKAANGQMIDVARSYGGPLDGVNIVFSVVPVE